MTPVGNIDCRSARLDAVAHPLLRPRWLIGTVLVALVVTGCLAAGFWQIRRLGERREVNAQVRSRSGTTVPLPDAGFEKDSGVVDDLIYRKVKISGTYDRSKEFLVRFRGRRGLPGYEVVTPLRTDRGTVLVDRGWVPLEQGDRWKVPSSTTPTGEVTIVGLLAPPEHGAPRIARPTTPDRPVITGSIAIHELSRVLEVDDLYTVHVLAAAGAGNAPFPIAVDPPDLGEGPHRDYAIQWFLFATVGVVGWTLLLKRRGPLASRTLRSGEQQLEGVVEG